MAGEKKRKRTRLRVLREVSERKGWLLLVWCKGDAHNVDAVLKGRRLSSGLLTAVVKAAALTQCVENSATSNATGRRSRNEVMIQNHARLMGKLQERAPWFKCNNTIPR